MLDANAVLDLGMAFHELITNAMRFGATDTGRIWVARGLTSNENGMLLSSSGPGRRRKCRLNSTGRGVQGFVLGKIVPSRSSRPRKLGFTDRVDRLEAESAAGTHQIGLGSSAFP